MAFEAVLGQDRPDLPREVDLRSGRFGRLRRHGEKRARGHRHEQAEDRSARPPQRRPRRKSVADPGFMQVRSTDSFHVVRVFVLGMGPTSFRATIGQIASTLSPRMA